MQPKETPAWRLQACEAETYVAEALIRGGWCVVGRNIRHIGFELDIAAIKGSTLAVVEVKARRRPPNSERDLRTLLPPRKQRALLKGADALMSTLEHPVATVRLDLAVVYTNAQGRWHIAYYADALPLEN